jgi:hypothetical protein
MGMSMANFRLAAATLSLVFAGLASGCASRADRVADRPSAESSAEAIAPTGYGCSTADVFGAEPGAPVHQVASLGNVRAILTGTSTDHGGQAGGISEGFLTITTADRTTRTLPITAPAGTRDTALSVIDADNGATSDDADDDAGSLCVVRFTPGGAPVVMVALTTGGAHCCAVLRAVPTAASEPTADHDFGNYAPTIRRDPNASLLVSADNAFAYAFSSFAGSNPPIKLFTFSSGSFIDVTRAHPALVQADLASHWAAFSDSSNPEPLGALAGWAADKCLLDPSRTAPDMWSMLDKLNAAGGLTSSIGLPSGTGFIAAVRALLSKDPYCEPPRSSASSSIPGNA